MVEPPDGLTGDADLPCIRPGPHPEAAKLLFIDWALSARGQAVYQNEKILLYGSVRKGRAAMGDREAVGRFQTPLPTDWNDFVVRHSVFVKEWNAIMGL